MAANLVDRTQLTSEEPEILLSLNIVLEEPLSEDLSNRIRESLGQPIEQAGSTREFAHLVKGRDKVDPVRKRQHAEDISVAPRQLGLDLDPETRELDGAYEGSSPDSYPAGIKPVDD